MKASVLAITLLLVPALAHADRYRVYGGKVEAPEKPAAVEACEYRELIEKQRCNRRINKSECIKEIYRECMAFAEAGSASELPEDDD